MEQAVYFTCQVVIMLWLVHLFIIAQKNAVVLFVSVIIQGQTLHFSTTCQMMSMESMDNDDTALQLP